MFFAVFICVRPDSSLHQILFYSVFFVVPLICVCRTSFFFFLLSKNIPFVTERLCDEWDPVFFLCFPMINRSRWPKRLWSPFSNNCDWRGCRERCASVCLYQTREEKKKKLGDSWMTLEKQQRRNWMANEVRRVIWQRGESKRLVSHWRAGWRKKEGVFRS